MPHPTGPRRPIPEELAKQIAARLEETGEPTSQRFSVRNSVVVGRLLSGTIVVCTAAVLVLGIFAGVDLLVGNASAEPPQVLSLEMSREDKPTTNNRVPTTRDLEDFIGLVAENPTETTGLGLVTATIPGSAGIGVPMPGVPNTSTTAPSGRSSTTASPNTTSPPQMTTTQPSPTSTSAASMTTTSTSTSNVSKPTIPSTTTTVTIPTTTPPTTITSSTTTTLEASTTTLVENTTTTCGNSGKGKGNC